MIKKQLLLSIIPIAILIVVAQGVFAQGIEIPQGTGLSEDTFAVILDRVLNWMLMIFVVIAVIAFVITGLQFIFSFGGASGTQENAKKNLTYTIIAIFIVGGALIILNTIVGLLGSAPAGGGGAANIGNSGNSQNTGGNFDFGTNIPSSSSENNLPTTTSDPNATAGPNGGVYIPDGVYNPSPSDSETTSNPSATGGGTYIPEGVYNQ